MLGDSGRSGGCFTDGYRAAGVLAASEVQAGQGFVSLMDVG